MQGDEIQHVAHADETVLVPICGKRERIGHVADPVFALELLGTSAAIEPSDGTLISPVSGTVTLLPDTLHAIGITSDGGAELLVHVGIDTIMLHGAPFTPHVKVGDHVEAGDVLNDVDLDAIRDAGYAATVIVIVTNTEEYAVVEKLGAGLVSAGDELMHLIA